MNDEREQKDIPDSTVTKAHEFTVEDQSFIAPLLKGLVSVRVVKLLPQSYSANALTLTGASCAAAVAVLLWIAPQSIRDGTAYGAMLLIASAVLIVAYAVFDQLDGMQARRLGTSGPFGDFLDHWVDTGIANLVPVPAMIIFSVPHPMIWLMAFWVAASFWSANWEVRQENKRILPYVGGLEAILVGCAMFGVTAFHGLSVWQQTVFGIKMLSIVYWCCLPWLVVVVIRAMLALPARKWTELGGLILSLAPISYWILWRLTTGSEVLTYNLAFIAFGLSATIMTGGVMRQHWLGSRYSSVDWPTFGLGAVMCITAHVSGSAAPSLWELMILALWVCFAVIRLVWQGIGTWRDLSGVR